MNHTLVTLLVATATLSGCAQTAPRWESRFGDAARQVRAQQVIDPAAPSRATGPMRTDGKAAGGAMKGYADAFGYSVKEVRHTEITVAQPAAR